MPRINFGVDLQLLLEAEKTFGLQLRLGAGMGPTALTIAPGPTETAFSLAQVLGALGKLLDLPALQTVADLGDADKNAFWYRFFQVSILPELTVVVAPQASSIQARLMLYTRPTRDPADYGIRFKDKLPPFITIEPDITLYDLIIGYWQKDGLDLKARIKIWPQETENVLTDGTLLVPLTDEPAGKSEVVKYPFPSPNQGGQTFRVNYLGLGQRFGPPTVGLESDPIAKIFEELKKLRSNDPKTVLNALVKDYYQPDRNWFFGADIYVKGWRVQALFNDPAIYGIRITADEGAFDGFKFEILYQKLGPDLGVYYGAISIPEKYRQINLGAVALKLPSFEIWIYTNGDFKVSVGWPRGPNSIGFEIYIFIGGCAFYFAKLRTGFNPRAAEPKVYYDPIIAFGLAIKLGLGRSINAGVFRAELSLTLQGVFQGILAWEGVDPKRLASPDPGVARQARCDLAKTGPVSGPPDYFWFSATVGIVGVLQGEVDLKIIKVSVSIRLSITTGLAFETGYAAVARVTAQVSAEASVRILFVTIKASFSLTLTETFQLSDGTGVASIDGPQNENFQGIVPGRLTTRSQALAAVYDRRALVPDTEPLILPVTMMLMPAALYRAGAGQSNLVAIPMIVPPGGPSAPTPYDALLVRLGCWLLRDYAPVTHGWPEVLEALGQGRDAAPDGFADALERFLADEVSFVLSGVDLTADPGTDLDLLPLPMLPPLQMAVPGREDSIVFADRTVPDGYEAFVRDYFADLALSGLSSNPDATARVGAAEPSDTSFAQMMFTDFFLMLARNMARRLAEPPVDGSDLPLGDVDADVAQIAPQLAGMAARTLLGGVILPVPSDIQAFAIDPLGVDLSGLFELSAQQFPADVSTATNAVTFSVANPDAPLSAAISFAEGTTATSTIPVASPPGAPNPIWRDARLRAGVADITISQMPSIDSVRRWFASRDHEAWADLGTARRVLLPQPELLGLTASGPLTLFGQRAEPDPTAPPTPDFDILPALMIQFRIRKVAVPSTGQFTDDGAPRPTELKGVYEISTTTDDVRSRIRMLLDSGDIGATRLDLVRIDRDAGGDRGYATLPTAAPDNSVYLFKTNLSTLTQPDNLFRPLMLGAVEEDDPDDAGIGDVAAFLRLIWQASVVNATGFFLHYTDASGAPLPDDMFDDTGAATLTVMASATAPRALRPYDNALILPGDVADTAFIAADDADGAPVQVHHPAYQAGCVAFQIDWTTAPALTIAEAERPAPFAPETVAALYDLIQYRVRSDDQPAGFDPSLWSLPLSRAKDTRDIALGDAGPGRYRQVVPAYRFGTGAENTIYGVTGRRPELQFRLLDTYGNALAEADHTVAFEVLYHDPLVPLGEWPGTQSTYRVGRDDDGRPCLFLTLDFQPDEIVRRDVHRFMTAEAGATDTDKAARQAEIARFRYGLILAQLRDPNVEAEVLSTFFGPPAPLGAVKDPLRYAADRIVADLDALLQHKTPLVPRRITIPVPFDPAALTGQPDTIFAITVQTQLRRTAFVDPLAAERLPEAAQSRWTVPLDLSVPPENRQEGDGPEPAEVDLRHFANQLEDAFRGYDGADGLLKLTVRNGVSDFAAAGAEPVLWGLKWSASSGLDVRFDAGSVAYFTLVPISTKLQGHAGVPVTLWDADLTPTEETRAFSEIDVDSWARQFLATMDRIMGPAVSSVVVGKGQGRFAEFATAKRLLAECLKAGVEPILVPDVRTARLSTFGARQVVPGDLTSARDRFEQHVLTRLAAAYDSLVVMQMAAEVTNAQAAQAGVDAPRIFGGVKATGTTPSTGDTADAFSVSNTRLPTEPPADSGPRFANFLVSAVNPSRQAKLDMALVWKVGFVEHRIASAHRAGGYVPSSWLRVVDSDLASELAFDLGEVSVPIPSISYPAVPVMEAQSAIQQFAGTADSVDDFFLWSYESVIRKTEKDAKDTLFAELRLNERVVIERAPAALARGPGETGDVVPLFEALARYAVAWPELETLLEALVAKEGDLPIADDLLDVVFGLVKDVAIYWAGFRGVPIPARWQTATPRAARMTAPPAEETISYAIDFEKAFEAPGQLIVTSEQSAIWPRINGEDGKTGPDAFTRLYAYDAEADRLALRWRDLSALDRQTARLTTWLKRNSNLGEGGDLTVNPNLVYATPASTYASPVIPRLRIDEFRNDETAPDLATTLLKTFNVVLGVASVLKNTRAAKIETRYEYSLIRDPRAAGSALTSRASVLLADGVVIDLATAKDDADPIKAIADAIAADVTFWHERAGMPTMSARLVQSLVLFAVIQDVHQPILNIDRIVYDVPEGWWTG